MIAAFGTLAFLTTLWLLVGRGARVRGKRRKVAVAPKGKATLSTCSRSGRTRARLQTPMRATPRRRAAA